MAYSRDVECCPLVVLLANEIHDMSALKWIFCNLLVLARKLAYLFGHPTQGLHASSTCDFLRVRLARALQTTLEHVMHKAVPHNVKMKLNLSSFVDYVYLHCFLRFGFVPSGGFGKKKKVGEQDKKEDETDILTSEGEPGWLQKVLEKVKSEEKYKTMK